MKHTSGTNMNTGNSGGMGVGCVSFLNSKPLIDGAEDPVTGLGCPVVFDVPSRLLGMLLEGRVKAALCPVIDFQLSGRELKVVPAGGICCRGKTLTVRVFSRKRLEDVTRVYADTDSHTSVNLMRVLFWRLYGRGLEVVPLDRSAGQTGDRECMLLIGDKVVTQEPSAAEYPYQLDLGEAWHGLTGMPFVFATWLALAETDLGDLPDRLERLRRRNEARLDEVVGEYAGAHGWDARRAREYLGGLLHYSVGAVELDAMQQFWREAHALGLFKQLRPMRVEAAGAGRVYSA